MSEVTSTPSNSLFDLWGSFGVELMIFAATFFFAILMKWNSSSHQVRKPKRKDISEVDEASVSPSRKTPTGAPSPCQQRGGRAATPPPGDRTRPEQWEVINHVVEGMKEHQGMKFILRVLPMYDDLKAAMEAEGVTLPQVARCSRHSAAEFYTALIQCVVRANRVHLIDGIIDDMIQQGVKRSLVFYESAMKQLAGQKQYQAALSVFDRLAADGLEPSAVTCSCLIGFAVEAGELRRALGFFEELSAISTPSIRAYMTILRVHGKRGDWKSSLSTLRDMRSRNVPIDSLVLNTVLATGIGSNQLQAVKALIAETEKHVPPLPDVVSYNTLIKGCSQHGDADGAMQALDRMRQRGLNPNAISFNTCMDAAVRAGRLSEAWKVLEEMRAARWRPDKFSCSILIKGITQCPDRENVEAGLNLVREASSACDNALLSSMYHSLLEAASQAGDATLAAKAYSQMSQQGVSPKVSAQRMLVKILPSSGGV